MDNERTKFLKEFYLSPYIQLATALIGKSREAGGNMFRHQMDTMAILIDYAYIDSVLLKAAVVHDLIEDLPNFNRNHLLTVDYESPQVFELVIEVSRLPGETKADFLTRILEKGSERALLLKTADRISNMISLGFVNNIEFVKRYTEETAKYVFPIAEKADRQMLRELGELVESRRNYVTFMYHHTPPDRAGNTTS
ncbi:MAG: hypothetical protein LBG74_07400 [Spirochaetaceae bacterium]|jgi:(p)ppGpp synthase/HD superfamily hydrolase|nr:hypothetical protein [Spirochaetaceae bacterium]